MNRIADEILSNLGISDFFNDSALMHIGKSKEDGAPVGSGRYPVGSGENPNQHHMDFYTRVKEMKNDGMTDSEIAELLGMKSPELRARYSLGKDMTRNFNTSEARRMLANGATNSEVCAKFGITESTLRSWKDEDRAARANKAESTAEFLREKIKERGMLDIGEGVEKELDISKEKFEEALVILKDEGYPIYNGRLQQITNPDKFTTQRVLCPIDTEYKEIYTPSDISTITDYKHQFDENGNDTFTPKFQYPASLDSSRLQVVWPADGGTAKDGNIEIRPGLADLDLGNSSYAQVRIMVDGTHYLKGMAMYNPDLPEGVDVRFSTSKDPNTKKLMGDVLKPIKDDPEDPFGSLIKDNGQYEYIDANGEKKLGLINKCREEGEWSSWQDRVPSQMLSKQPLPLIKQQLDRTKQEAVDQLNEIMEITNPTVRKKMLLDYAEGCDSDAVDLAATAFPRQGYHVFIPMPMPEGQVYAPNYENGEKVAIIRFPHASTAEIPVLTVNNNIPEVKKLMGNAKDAIGINEATAQQLSGADFDGDAGIVFPCNSDRSSIYIQHRPYYEELKNFDPHMQYASEGKTGVKLMKKENVGKQMGVVSNLITDMTLKGAPDEDIIKAIKHSMVVIDAYKHKLDYKQSEVDNDIAELKRKWQGHYEEDGSYHEGASTLVSLAKKDTHLLKQRGSAHIDKETGEWIINRVEEHYTDKHGKDQVRTEVHPLMATVKDANELVKSNNDKERAYADYANFMKSLANHARKIYATTKDIAYDAHARSIYKDEVAVLEAELKLSELNAPRERQAQRYATTKIKALLTDEPNMSKADKKKASNKALVRARQLFGAKRHKIQFTDKQWEAIQSGAVPSTMLNKLLKYADMDIVRQKASPRGESVAISTSTQARIRSLAANGKTQQQIAEELGISTSTVNKYS